MQIQIISLVYLFNTVVTGTIVQGTGSPYGNTTLNSTTLSLSTKRSSTSSAVTSSTPVVIASNSSSAAPFGTGYSLSSTLSLSSSSSSRIVIAGNKTIPTAGPTGNGVSTTTALQSSSSNSHKPIPGNATSLYPVGTGSSPVSKSSMASHSSSTSRRVTLGGSNSTFLPGTASSKPSSTPGDVVTGNMTLLPGQAITTSGTTYLYSSGTEYVNGKTTPLPTSTSTNSQTDPVTSTMTTEPSGLSTEAIDATTFTTNGWLTTTASDSSETVVPVILPCLDCAPIIIWNLPSIPDVTFDWPKLPKLPTFHFPCIKVFGMKVGDCPTPPETDGPPPEDSEPTTNPSTSASKTDSSTSSESSCTHTQTASDCRVLCKPTPTNIGNFNTTTQSCSTTCFKTMTGCSVTGETTTTTTTTSEAPTCSVTKASWMSADPNVTGSPCSASCRKTAAASPSVTARAVLPLQTQRLRKRAIAPATAIKVLGPRNQGCPIPAGVSRPAYPRGGDYLAAEQAGQLYGASADAVRWVTTAEGCAAPAAIQTIGVNEFVQEGQSATSDHSFEIGWLKGFFNNYIILKNKPTQEYLNCNDMQTYFFRRDSSGNTNRLAAIFNALPSGQNIQDFAFMNTDMNSNKKGRVANVDNINAEINRVERFAVTPDTPATQAAQDLQSKLDVVDTINTGILLINYQPVMAQIVNVYTRIYRLLQGVDDTVSCQGWTIQGFPGLAQSFVNYMAYLFTDPTWGISSVASKGASKLLQQVHDGLVALQQQPASGGQSFQQANPGEWQILYETYLSFVSLGDPSDTGNANWQVQFDAASLAANAKRDLSERQACTLPSSSGSGPATTATGQVTVTGPNGVVSTIAANSTLARNGTTTALATQTSSSSTSTSSSSTSSLSSISTTTSAVESSSSTVPPPTSTTPEETPTSTTPTPTPTESCHTQYVLVLDKFDIYGANWDESKLGSSGEGLLDNLRGCSAITKWKFENETVTADSPWAFHASGQSTIWQKNCIEHAMLSAGAPDDDCSGSG